MQGALLMGPEVLEALSVRGGRVVAESIVAKYLIMKHSNFTYNSNLYLI